MEQIIKQLADYISDNVWNYENRAQIALDIIDHNRCSLQQADYALYCSMYDAVEEYISDNNLPYNPDEIDLESILFNI